MLQIGHIRLDLQHHLVVVGLFACVEIRYRRCDLSMEIVVEDHL